MTVKDMKKKNSKDCRTTSCWKCSILFFFLETKKEKTLLAKSYQQLSEASLKKYGSTKRMLHMIPYEQGIKLQAYPPWEAGR